MVDVTIIFFPVSVGDSDESDTAWYPSRASPQVGFWDIGSFSLLLAEIVARYRIDKKSGMIGRNWGRFMDAGGKGIDLFLFMLVLLS